LSNTILEKKLEYNGAVYHIFIDFKKAHNSGWRKVLYNILTEFGIPVKLVSLKRCLNKTYNRVWVGKHLFDVYPITNGLKQGDAVLPLLFNFASEYAHQEGLKLNSTHQLHDSC